LTFDLLTLKSVWESHVTWSTPVQSFVFIRQMDGRTDDGRR